MLKMLNLQSINNAIWKGAQKAAARRKYPAQYLHKVGS